MTLTEILSPESAADESCGIDIFELPLDEEQWLQFLTRIHREGRFAERIGIGK
jgi:hypothetical protein